MHTVANNFGPDIKIIISPGLLGSSIRARKDIVQKVATGNTILRFSEKNFQISRMLPIQKPSPPCSSAS